VVALALKHRLSKAALECNVSEAALTVQIRKMERTLHRSLFDPRKGCMTPAGQTIADQARSILE